MRFSVRPIRILSLLILVSITSAYVFASGAVASKTSASEAGSAKVFGKLVTTSNRPILVNGGAAITGSVILSGAQLSTPASSFATVQLDRLGTVTVAPSSNVTLNYDAKNITVRVASGDAVVSTVAGVTGKVLGANGEALTANANPTPVSAETARNWGIAGVAVGGGAFVWAIIAWNKANNAQDDADAANAAAASLASQLAALRTCLAGQTTSPVKLCTSF